MNSATHALGEYKVGNRIASGGFGYVYGGEAPDGTQVAIKYERTYSRIKRPYLQHEADVYRLLEGDPCVPKVYAYGREERWNMMVFDLLGTSLESLHEKCGDKFSLKTTLMLAPQLIECIEYCHSKGIIHRDIKPDNFLMGRGDRANLVHIVDFGLARRFRHPKTQEHFPWFEGHNFFGTTRFASLHALEGCSQSRRDDLESAAYSLVYFLRGRLPWQGIRGGTDKHRDQRVREKKRSWTPERLCEDLPEEFAQMLTYIKNLGYEDEPDYAYLKGLFRDRLEKEGFELDYDYDWLHIAEEEDVSEAGATEEAKSRSVSSIISGRISVSSDKISEDLNDADDESARSKSSNEHRVHSVASGQLSDVSSRPSVHSEEVASSVRDEDSDHPSASDVEIAITKQSSNESVYGHSSSDDTTATESMASQSVASARKSGASKSATSASKSSKGETTVSEVSNPSSEEDPEAPVKKGDVVLVKLLPRDTLEFDDTWTSSRAVDNSYWHNPSLSADDWHFSWRPAVVTDVDAGNARTRLYVLPIMHRADGLEKISPARRPAFFKIRRPSEAETSSDEKVEVETTPAWPRDETYVYHQMVSTRVLVPNDSVEKLEVVWRLEKPELKRLLAARDSVKDLIEEDSELSVASEETATVRRKQRKHRNMGRFAVFGDIASLTEKTFDQANVEFKGSNGWLPEFIKIERRRNDENGWYSGSSDGSDEEEDENLSCFTGTAPGNRRLSCTLAIDGDVILEAASVAGSEPSSVVSSKYHSSRGSSYHGSRASSLSNSSYKSKDSSRRLRAASPAHSLRNLVLDSAARHGSGSRCSSRACSVAGSSRSSSLALSEKSSVAPSSAGSAAALSTLRSVAHSDDVSVASSGADSDAVSVAKSVARSIARSFTSVAGSISSMVGSDAGGYNREASAANKKVMVDEAAQTDSI